MKCPQVLSEDPNPAGVAFKTEDKILMSAVASLEVPSSKKDSKPSQLKHSASCNPAAPVILHRYSASSVFCLVSS